MAVQPAAGHDQIRRPVEQRLGLGARFGQGGVAEVTSFLAGPGVIKHHGDFARIRFGELDGRISDRATAIRDALEAAGIEVELSNDIRRLLWLKFILIVAASNMTALTRQTNGPIRECPQTRALLVKSLEEVCDVARAKGVALDDDTVEERLAFFDRTPPHMTSSMAQDLAAGNRLELNWLAGYVARAGAELGVPTPFNKIVHDLLVLNANGRSAGDT